MAVCICSCRFCCQFSRRWAEQPRCYCFWYRWVEWLSRIQSALSSMWDAARDRTGSCTWELAGNHRAPTYRLLGKERYSRYRINVMNLYQYNIAKQRNDVNTHHMFWTIIMRLVVYYHATGTTRLPAGAVRLSTKRYKQLLLKFFRQLCSCA
jgi:hypothetical protein